MNPDLFGRIDRVLHECDASQLPPLTDEQRLREIASEGAFTVLDTGETLVLRNGQWRVYADSLGASPWPSPAGVAEYLEPPQPPAPRRSPFRWPWNRR